MTAASPLGPWQPGGRISSDSCGGQPTNVATFERDGVRTYLYQSDLWRNGEPNQALANYYWGPLSFDSRGAIARLRCLKAFAIDSVAMP